MTKNKKVNFTKKNISKKIEFKTGLSNLYINEIIDDFIDIIKNTTKQEKLNIKNFGVFKIIKKKERLGRNPKNKKIYKIAARKSLSFIISKKFNDEINKL